MQIKPLKYRLALVHKLLFHPFVHPDLVISLKEKKYSLQQIPPIPPGPRAYIDGYIAMKNECLVETNNEKKLLAVDGVDNEKTIQVMKDIISMSQKDFNVNLDTDLDFIELTAHCIIATDKNPLEAFNKFKSCTFDRFTELLGSEATLFGVRLTPNNSPPSSKYWYDIQIQPRLTKSDKEYYVSIIYRAEDVEKVIDFCQKINSKIESIITLIEEG